MSGKRPDGKVDLVQQKEKIMRNKVSMAVRSLLTIACHHCTRRTKRMLNRLRKVDKNTIKKCFKKEEKETNLDVNR